MNKLKELNGLNSKQVILEGDFKYQIGGMDPLEKILIMRTRLLKRMLGIMNEFNLTQVEQ